MHRNFNRNLQTGYGISILMLVVMGFISYQTVYRLLESNQAVVHSNLLTFLNNGFDLTISKR